MTDINLTSSVDATGGLAAVAVATINLTTKILEIENSPEHLARVREIEKLKRQRDILLAIENGDINVINEFLRTQNANPTPLLALNKEI